MTRLTIGIILYSVLIQAAAATQSSLWEPLVQSQRGVQDKALNGQLYRVDTVELRQRLFRAAPEGRSADNSSIEIPLADGEIQRFQLESSPVMAPELAARYPEITSYRIYGIDNPHATGRVSLSPAGFHGMISSPAGTVFIDPQSEGVYRAYRRQVPSAAAPFNCGVEGHSHDSPLGELDSRPALRTAGSLRVYRLALATTGEYVEAIGAANKTAALSEMNNAINRVNQIYERDLGIRLQLVANNDLLIYTNKNSDPYTDPASDLTSSAEDLLLQNQTNIRNVIGSPNYDIGHVFSRGGGGLAQVGAVCVDGKNDLEGDFKAGGVTGLNNPTGENFYIDYVAHEIGHQFNAEHSFNGTTRGCSGSNRVQQSAYEPGSGSTIMSYAGICGSENIVDHADAMFHAGSIAQIDSYTSAGAGASCGSLLSNNNPAEPSANAGNDFTIPAQTPFVLTATGSDTDGDAITYSWDQMDAGTATTNLTFGKDLGNNSLFRSYLPQASNERHFPALGTTLNNQYDYSEVLPCRSRNINFRLSVLDGKSGIANDNVRLTVDAGSGPFEITSHTSAVSLIPGTQVLNWNVANTNQAPVNCSSVDISLLTFNAAQTTYSETLLLDNEPNDGRAFVPVPIQSSIKARFKIQCSNNIFYDISDADLSFSSLAGDFPVDEKTVVYNTGGVGNSIFSSPAEVCIGNVVTPATSSSGGGVFSLSWLLSLLGGWLLRCRVLRSRVSGVTAL